MSSFCLKILACISMLIDHIGLTFFPDQEIFRIIGRIAFPLFVFQLCVGFSHTKDEKKYIIRMLLLALTSQIPYFLMVSTRLQNISLNVCFTFTLCLLILYCLKNIKNIFLKLISVILLVALSAFIKIDYGIYATILTLIFYLFKNRPYFMIPAFFVLNIIYCTLKGSALQAYSLISLFPIFFYNGKKGANIKWFFYIFYPMHLIIIYLIYTVLCSMAL